MLSSTYPDVPFSPPPLVVAAVSETRQVDRIRAALGLKTAHVPKVDEKALARYYEYLSANLSFPFVAHYPQPTNSPEEREFRRLVLGLVDPQRHLGDEFDGLFCKIRKGHYETNLPLIELDIHERSTNFQLIEDYWYWFWNWR
jgi:hypothetical protein